MVIYTFAPPPTRRVIRRDYCGIDNALVVLTLECGHQWAGLSADLASQQTRVCNQCVSRIVSEAEFEQIKRDKERGQARLF